MMGIREFLAEDESFSWCPLEAPVPPHVAFIRALRFDPPDDVDFPVRLRIVLNGAYVIAEAIIVGMDPVDLAIGEVNGVPLEVAPVGIVLGWYGEDHVESSICGDRGERRLVRVDADTRLLRFEGPTPAGSPAPPPARLHLTMSGLRDDPCLYEEGTSFFITNGKPYRD